MKKIKFRGLRTDNSEWVYGYYGFKEETNKQFIMVETISLHSTSYFTDYEVNPESIGQFTGLKDKNRTDIYECDIVEEPYFSNVNPNDHDDDDYLDNTPRNYVICYDSNQAKYKMVPISTYLINAGNGGWTGYEVKYERITVIGNIYANADLLK